MQTMSVLVWTTEDSDNQQLRDEQGRRVEVLVNEYQVEYGRVTELVTDRWMAHGGVPPRNTTWLTTCPYEQAKDAVWLAAQGVLS